MEWAHIKTIVRHWFRKVAANLRIVDLPSQWGKESCEPERLHNYSILGVFARPRINRKAEGRGG